MQILWNIAFLSIFVVSGISREKTMCFVLFSRNAASGSGPMLFKGIMRSSVKHHIFEHSDLTQLSAKIRRLCMLQTDMLYNWAKQWFEAPARKWVAIDFLYYTQRDRPNLVFSFFGPSNFRLDWKCLFSSFMLDTVKRSSWIQHSEFIFWQPNYGIKIYDMKLMIWTLL